jgi:hypothetical protein
MTWVKLEHRMFNACQQLRHWQSGRYFGKQELAVKVMSLRPYTAKFSLIG